MPILLVQLSNQSVLWCRPTPLTAKGGANVVNSQSESPESSPPESIPAMAIKKPKGVEKSKAAVSKKRGLKRL